MKRHFLMGSDAIQSFRKGGAKELLACKDNYSIIHLGIGDSLEFTLDMVIGWDEYLELNQKDLEEIKVQKNKNEWDEFYKIIDPDDTMSDGEFIDYLYKYYEVPSFLEIKQEPLEEEDLFEHFEFLPDGVRKVILEYFNENVHSYEKSNKLIDDLKPFGYTCQYGLDAIPYNLKKI